MVSEEDAEDRHAEPGLRGPKRKVVDAPDAPDEDRSYYVEPHSPVPLRVSKIRSGVAKAVKALPAGKDPDTSAMTSTVLNEKMQTFPPTPGWTTTNSERFVR